MGATHMGPTHVGAAHVTAVTAATAMVLRQRQRSAGQNNDGGKKACPSH